MSALQHNRIHKLSPAAVFRVLIELGNEAKSELERLRQNGETEGWIKMVSFYGAPPNVDVARLLLHILVEDKNIFWDNKLGLYLFLNSRILRRITDTPSDTVGWEEAATYIMAAIQNRIQIYYDSGKWKIICSSEIRQVKEIRELIEQIQPTQGNIIYKNIITGSEITTGGNIHIGDINKINTLAAEQIQAFIDVNISLLNEGKLAQALIHIDKFSKPHFPEICQKANNLLNQLKNLEQSYSLGYLTHEMAQVTWHGLYNDSMILLEKLRPN